MTLREIVDNTLDEQFVINEGFVTCPAIFYYAFSKPIGSLKVTAEKISNGRIVYRDSNGRFAKK